MFSAIRNNIGYQNVMVRHSAEYETTDIIDIRLNGRVFTRVASMGASGGSTAELSPLTDHAKNGWYGLTHAKFWRKGSDPPLLNAPIRPIRAHSRVQRNHQNTHLQD